MNPDVIADCTSGAPCPGSVGLGLPCTTASDCSSGFCADGVCCDSACDATGELCNAPGSLGVCTGALAAPVASHRGLLGLAIVLLLLGFGGLRRLRS